MKHYGEIPTGSPLTGHQFQAQYEKNRYSDQYVVLGNISSDILVTNTKTETKINSFS